MKNKHIIIFALILLMVWGCDRDQFAELNTNPSTISEPDLRYSAAKAIEQMYSDDYTTFFYNNFQYIMPWTQVTLKQGGNTTDFLEMGPTGGHNIYSSLIPQAMDIRYRIDAMNAEDKAIYQSIQAITYPMVILPAMTRSDVTGSMVYTQAGLAPYTNPPLLTPVLDNESTLYNTWLTELNKALTTLTTAQNQFSMGNQDIIYKGDYSKWAKLCNLLKLRIAARLVNKDKAKALSIAAEVAASPAGYMDNLNDDFVYNRGIKYYGTGNGMWIGFASKNLADFLVTNKDPRVRFIFEKNSFNAEVVQAFLDNAKELPPYVAAKANIEGNKFVSWKAPGEPWVRYFGAPVSPDARLNPVNNIYFNQDVLYKLTVGSVSKNYTATSLYSEKMVRTSYDFTYPTKPGGRVLQLKDNDPGLNVLLGSAAETNLYLAEFKLLGANLPKSAQDYFNQGVTLSIQRMDALAKANQMPYYESDPVYADATAAADAATKLRAGEITALLAQPAYSLATDGLEKVYIQQYINFMGTPHDLWATVRRSGVPKKGSSYLAWENVTGSGVELKIPRRFVIGTPTEDDINYANKKAAVTEMGVTTGTNNPTTLSTERLWFDKENPNYGAGPK
ncbi:MAG: SusD/RagB family nutrient-binding outer membrane lipoprotein [Prolixibacteraceae bacterium]|nr:SusD/RagB family nutrient-binding outer membrane lipoprotein [Prolixibacteraceae bacterium]